jgi:hypothetical protein
MICDNTLVSGSKAWRDTDAAHRLWRLSENLCGAIEDDVEQTYA